MLLRTSRGLVSIQRPVRDASSSPFLFRTSKRGSPISPPTSYSADAYAAEMRAARAVHSLLSAAAALPGEAIEESLGGPSLSADEAATLLRKILNALRLNQKYTGLG